MDRKHLLIHAGLATASVLLVVVVLLSVSAIREFGTGSELSDFLGSLVRGGKTRTTGSVGTFASVDDFRQYLSSGQSLGGGRLIGGVTAVPESMNTNVGVSASKDGSSVMSPVASSFGATSGGTVAQGTLRVSETNVRTEGVDEPDIVKTDGNHIYFSREPRYPLYRNPQPMPLPAMKTTSDATVSSGSAVSGRPGIIPPSYPAIPPTSATDIFSVSDAGSAALLGSIGKTGETILYGDTLVLFESSGRNVIGYDVSDRKNPKEKWIVVIGDDSNILEARKRDDRLYLVERTGVNAAQPCPIRPMTSGTTVSEMACTDIYRPSTPSPVDSVFTALSLDPETGTVGDKVSFVGTAGQSVVYMGVDSLYVTYPSPADPVAFLLGFFRENGAGLFSIGFLDHLERLAGYDIGLDAKLAELSRLIGNEYLGKGQDEQLRLQTETSNRMADYGKKHLRELGSTGIVKIALDGFSVAGQGEVPGTPLNDFSLDEYDGDLRVATTSGGSGSFYLPGMSLQGIPSENDVYVLDGNLKKTGELLGLGTGERIYSARFIGDRGYLVTFKQTDPFYVLDLSNPAHPKRTGELQIPGYSSYLHSLGDHLVLGLGREENRVKLSLFEVSDPAHPQEISKYLLDEFWSEATDDRRAFLADPKHKVFFLPGSQGGYVVSYEGNALSLKKAVAGQSIRRAIFIGDTLYVISDASITSYDENTWEKKGETGIR